jgi:hypothetical protein
MNQKEKHSPNPASINNNFYSQNPPLASFIFRKNGREVTESLCGWGLGIRDKQGSQGRKKGEVSLEAAAPVDCRWWLQK